MAVARPNSQINRAQLISAIASESMISRAEVHSVFPVFIYVCDVINPDNGHAHIVAEYRLQYKSDGYSNVARRSRISSGIFTEQI